jgi:hypothetical protein
MVLMCHPQIGIIQTLLWPVSPPQVEWGKVSLPQFSLSHFHPLSHQRFQVLVKEVVRVKEAELAEVEAEAVEAPVRIMYKKSSFGII